MSEEIVRFSRLLRIFKLNNNPAFIVELEENNEKTLYISYNKNDESSHCFESYEKSTLKKEFKYLSDHCLMKECKDSTAMFENSHLTHFEADCSSLVCGFSMFNYSKLNSIKTEFPSLEDGDWMFFSTKIKEININFPKLKKGNYMFNLSYLEKTTSQFPMLEKSVWMFHNTPPELKQNCPQYFV